MQKTKVNKLHTGLTRLGEISNKWEVKRLKYAIKKKKGKNPQKIEPIRQNGYLPYITASSFENYNYDSFILESEDLIIVNKDDVIILWDGARAGFIDTAHFGFLSSTMVSLTLINNDFDKRFFYFYLKSKQSIFQDFANGTTIPHADVNMLDNLYILCPPLLIQKNIANYLDEKNEKVKKLIKDKKRMIGLLQEQKQAIIHHAVTRGIKEKMIMDSNVKGEWNKLSDEEKNIICQKVDFIYTHIEEDECGDRDKKRTGEKIATNGFILGRSRLNQAKLTTEDDATVIDHMQGNAQKGKHLNDGLLLSTAKAQNAIVVSSDERLKKKGSELGIRIVSFEKFLLSIKTKYSGVPWLGEVPKDWRTAKVKQIVSTKITDGPHETPEFFSEGIPFASAESVFNGKINFESVRGFISKEQDEIYSLKCKPKIEDIFIVKSGSTTGKLAVLEEDIDFNIWSPLALVRVNKELVFYKYLFHFLTSDPFQKQVQTFWSFGTQPNIGMGVLENLFIVLPPLPNQRKIVEYIEKESKIIDSAITKIEQEIVLIEEYKKSLIYHAVTGKITV